MTPASTEKVDLSIKKQNKNTIKIETPKKQPDRKNHQKERKESKKKKGKKTTTRITNLDSPQVFCFNVLFLSSFVVFLFYHVCFFWFVFVCSGFAFVVFIIIWLVVSTPLKNMSQLG